MILTLLLAPCGQAFAEEIDYEAEALQKAREAWAAKTQTDPLRSIVDSMCGPGMADSYETMVGSQGGIPASMLGIVLSVVRYSSTDVPLDLKLLNQALKSAEDPEAQERIRAEMQWGRPTHLELHQNAAEGVDSVSAEVTYDDAGRRTGIAADEFTISYTYDENGKLSEKRLEIGTDYLYVIRYQYDEEGRETACEMDANGYTASFRWEYDGAGNLTRSEQVIGDMAAQTLVLSWNEDGELIGVGDGSGSELKPLYESDAESFTLRIEVGDSTIVYSGSFDAGHRITATENQSGSMTASTEMEYGEGGGLLWKRSEYIFPNNTNATEYLYNEYGSLTSTKQSVTTEQYSQEFVFECRYDGFGRCEAVVGFADGAEQGEIITFTY